MSDGNFRRELLEQARELVFNKGADAAALAFRGDGGREAAAAELSEMDLSALSSIHRVANGSVELKFIDRIKLIELLLAACDDRRADGSGDGFIQALDRAAQRLGGAGAPAPPEEDADSGRAEDKGTCGRCGGCGADCSGGSGGAAGAGER